jgi:hypothetical protein
MAGPTEPIIFSTTASPGAGYGLRIFFTQARSNGDLVHQLQVELVGQLQRRRRHPAWLACSMLAATTPSPSMASAC